MKRQICILLVLVLSLLPCGCAGDNQVTNAQAHDLLQKVLSGEQSFTVYNEALGRTYQANLTDFSYPTANDALNGFVPAHYTFADFDGNGVEDLMVLDIRFLYSLFFHCEGDAVYCYVHKDVEPKYVKTDGTLQTIQHLSGDKTILSLSFSGTGCTVYEHAYYNEKTDTYRIDGKAATKQSADQYFKEWDEETPTVSWTKIEA